MESVWHDRSINKMNNYFSMNTLKSVTEHLPAKIIASAGVTSVSSALGIHLQVYIAFAFLIPGPDSKVVEVYISADTIYVVRFVEVSIAESQVAFL